VKQSAIVLSSVVIVLLVIATTVSATGGPARSFRGLVKDFNGLAQEIDGFLAAVLDHPADFDEKFTELAGEFRAYVTHFDDRVAKLSAKFAEDGHPDSVTFTASCGDSAVLFSDTLGDLVLLTTCSFSDTFTLGFSGVETGPIWDVIRASTGEDIFLSSTVFTTSIDGEPGTITDRFAGSCRLPACDAFVGRWFMTTGTGTLADFHIAGPFVPGYAWGIAFGLGGDQN